MLARTIVKKTPAVQNKLCSSSSSRVAGALLHQRHSSGQVQFNGAGANAFELGKLMPGSSTHSSEKEVMVRLLLSLGSNKQTRQLLQRVSSSDAMHFAVLKIGGGVLEGAKLKALVSSIEFLKKVGFFPVVVHGGGPQLNAELDKAGEEPKYVEGLRVTTPKVLSIALRVFEKENTKLVEALEQAGIRARPVTGVFEATPLDVNTYGLVGKVSKIHSDVLASSILSGYIPVLTSLGMSTDGQMLNINADVAALELAKEIHPLKILFINTTAGMLNGDGKLINRIRLSEEYDDLMKQPWVKHGTRLKIKEIKSCLDALPPSSSVSIVSPENVAAELFEPRGLGTHISKGERVVAHTSLDHLDLGKIKTLLESAFKAPLKQDYFEELKKRLHRIYITESNDGVAILTKEAATGDVSYLDKFAVDEKVRGGGTSELLWSWIIKENPAMYWRSRVSNTANSWYFSRSQGHVRRGAEWIVFWYGIKENDLIEKCITSALSLPATMVQVKTDAYGTPIPQATTYVKPPAKGYRIGLLGARGHTGSNLIRLLSQHDHANLVCASSSTTAGAAVTTVCPTAPADLKFQDIKADGIAQITQDLGIDAWFLALHDNASLPYVDALTKGTKTPILIDLSADHRFDSAWVYGQPEGGMRSKLRSAKRIANPGCYATGMFTTLAPWVKSQHLDYATFFGISGYSGAGTKPSPKNDPARLNNNLLPYSLVNHNHEREVTHQSAHPVFFAPHVGQWFQGITLTGSVVLKRPFSKEEVEEKYNEFYAKEALIKISKEIPEVRDAMKKHGVTIGGFEVDTKARRVVTVTTLDNLLKGAATQAIQNMNIALGIEDELEGIRKEL